MVKCLVAVRRPALALLLLTACGEAPYEPTPARLIGEFSGDAGTGLEAYGLLVAIAEVGDSVRGQWSLGFQATCATHDGPFSGTLQEDRLRLLLRPDEDYEGTLELRLRVLPGDSILVGSLTLLAPGNVPGYEGPALCGSDELAPITLHAGEGQAIKGGR